MENLENKKVNTEVLNYLKKSSKHTFEVEEGLYFKIFPVKKKDGSFSLAAITFNENQIVGVRLQRQTWAFSMYVSKGAKLGSMRAHKNSLSAYFFKNSKNRDFKTRAIKTPKWIKEMTIGIESYLSDKDEMDWRTSEVNRKNIYHGVNEIMLKKKVEKKSSEGETFSS